MRLEAVADLNPSGGFSFCANPSAKREHQQARAEQDKTCDGYSEESV
jgi:hypothetical protein